MEHPRAHWKKTWSPCLKWESATLAFLLKDELSQGMCWCRVEESFRKPEEGHPLRGSDPVIHRGMAACGCPAMLVPGTCSFGGKISASPWGHGSAANYSHLLHRWYEVDWNRNQTIFWFPVVWLLALALVCLHPLERKQMSFAARPPETPEQTVLKSSCFSGIFGPYRWMAIDRCLYFQIRFFIATATIA